MFSKFSVIPSRTLVISRRLFSEFTPSIDAKKLVVQKTTTPKAKLPLNELVFGRSFTDHMLEIDWEEGKGWKAPRIIPYQNLSLSPASTGLHYGLQCFEGMKAYKDKDGNVRLFRPDKNMSRMNHSMTRLSMPPITDSDGLLECLKELIRIDQSWIPEKEGYSLYIRPTAIGSSPFLGVHASEHVKVYVILSPVGPYYKSGFKPVRLFADTKNVRAWPGGVGNAKVGGNYAPTIHPTQQAAKDHGVSQILWLFGKDHQVAEVGAMNIFFVIKNAQTGEKELITPTLEGGDILPGVTRDSIIEIAKTWTNVKVSERVINMGEVVAASKEGRLLEAFGAGTAAVISPVKGIVYNGEEIHVPTGENVGEVAQSLWNTLTSIQYGKIPHPWSVKI
jgi:branched-chain amino acid aminotransferase|eukprot:gene3-2_t